MSAQSVTDRARRLAGPKARQAVGPRYHTVRKGLPIWSGLRLYQRIVRGREGFQFGSKFSPRATDVRPDTSPESPNPLEVYFDSHHEGPGIWKWRHYFEVYHRYFSKFIGTDVRMVEIGIYSGGSLGMWKEYFGPKGRIYGVDIEEACRVYEDEVTRVFIGDQADPSFWQEFLSEVPYVDAVVDDGGHRPDQQVGAFEALFPHVRPGGVYICEDVGGLHNPFVAYMNGLSRNLYRPAARGVSPFQSSVDAVHYYPGMVVITKRDVPRTGFPDEKHGTEWQPFLG